MHPLQFLELPNDRQHDARILEAHSIISRHYNAALSLLALESTDHIRLQIYADRLSTNLIPLLEALERDLEDDIWVTEAATAVINLFNSLKTSLSWIATR